MLYGAKYWVTNKQHIHRMIVAEMRTLRWMSGKSRKEKIRKESIHRSLGVTPIDDKMMKVE